jgi:SAM-dependent methyltransferase
MLIAVLVLGYGLISVIFIALLFYFVILLDSTVGNFDFASSKLAVNQVVDIIKRRSLESGSFYDLGSARGKFAVRIARKFSGLKIYGFDDSWFRVFCSKTRSVFLKNLKFKKQDIFSADISSADIIYLYLPQELMPALQIKLRKELKPGSLIISNSVSFPGLEPSEILITNKRRPDFQKLFIYQIV